MRINDIIVGEARPPRKQDIERSRWLRDARRGRDLVPIFVALGADAEDAVGLSVDTRARAADSHDPQIIGLVNTLGNLAPLVQKHGLNALAQQVWHDEFWYDCLTREDWAELERRAPADIEDLVDVLHGNGISDLAGLDRFLGHASVASTIQELTDQLPDSDEMPYLLDRLADTEADATGLPGILQDETEELAGYLRELYDRLYEQRPEVRGRDW